MSIVTITVRTRQDVAEGVLQALEMSLNPNKVKILKKVIKPERRKKKVN